MAEYHEQIGFHIPFKRLLENLEDTADVIVIVKGPSNAAAETFQLHRIVLACQSKFFKEKLNASKRARNGETVEIKIDFITTNIFKMLVNWMYKHQLPINLPGTNRRQKQSVEDNKMTFSSLAELSEEVLSAAIILGIEDLPGDNILKWSKPSVITDAGQDPTKYFKYFKTMYMYYGFDDLKRQQLSTICWKLLKAATGSQVVDFMRNTGEIHEDMLKDIKAHLDQSKLSISR